YRKRKGRFMFPTAHDITDDPKILDACIKVIRNVISPGNFILITTKPRLSVIKTICREFKELRDLIQFRFTITTNNSSLIKFWEPGAPSFNERLLSLKDAFEKGFKTSVSIEPFLSNPISFIDKLLPYTTESIWIGPMNYIKRNGINDAEIKFYKEIRKLTTPENLIKIYNALRKYNLVRFKDSFLIKLKKARYFSKTFF
ncbi:MAG: hypothetical protein ACTSRH_14610, partial [Promethearchaeota archaeon]